MKSIFNIGQEVVANQDHTKGCFKKGQEFTIKAILGNVCNCGIIVVNIGVSTHYRQSICRCGKIIDFGDVFCQTRFSPKQEISNTTYNEVINWMKNKEIA
jgi:hypothetical protein